MKTTDREGKAIPLSPGLSQRVLQAWTIPEGFTGLDYPRGFYRPGLSQRVLQAWTIPEGFTGLDYPRGFYRPGLSQRVLQAWTIPEGSRRFRLPDFKTFRT